MKPNLRLKASPADKFEELQTAPPKQKIKLSWVGKTAAAIIAILVIIAFAGPFIAPFHEADMIADDSFLPADGQFWLGSDYLGRDIFSRILWGARTTIGISFIATLAAYFVGITLGIGAAVKGGWVDIGVSRVIDVTFVTADDHAGFDRHRRPGIIHTGPDPDRRRDLFRHCLSYFPGIGSGHHGYGFRRSCPGTRRGGVVGYQP